MPVKVTGQRCEWGPLPLPLIADTKMLVNGHVAMVRLGCSTSRDGLGSMEVSKGSDEIQRKENLGDSWLRRAWVLCGKVGVSVSCISSVEHAFGLAFCLLFVHTSWCCSHPVLTLLTGWQLALQIQGSESQRGPRGRVCGTWRSYSFCCVYSVNL